MNDEETANTDTYLQIFVPLNRAQSQYREYRVNMTDLNWPPMYHYWLTVKEIADNVREIVKENLKEIYDLRLKLQKLEQTNYLWDQLPRVRSVNAMEVVLAVVRSYRAREQFLLDNFINEESWTKIREYEEGDDLQTMFSTVNVVNETGIVLQRNYKKPPVVWSDAEEEEDSEYDDEEEEAQNTNVVENKDNKETSSVSVNEASTSEEEVKNEPNNDEKPLETSERVFDKASCSISCKVDQNCSTSANFTVEKIEEKNVQEMEKENVPEEAMIVKTPESNPSSEPTDDQPECSNTENSKNASPQYPNMIQIETDHNLVSEIEDLSAEEQEEIRKLTVVEQIAELKAFIDEENGKGATPIDRIKHIVDSVLTGKAQKNFEHAQRLEDMEKEAADAKENEKVLEPQMKEKEKEEPKINGNEEEEDDEQEDEDEKEDNESEIAQSEKSHETCTTSTNAESETYSTEQSISPPVPKKKQKGPVANKKNKGKKGKKQNKKKNKGPKVTMEEVEAIKKRKKIEADVAFELRDRAKKTLLTKIATSDRHRLFHKVAETATAIQDRPDLEMPPIIGKLDRELDLFIKSTKYCARILLREMYFKDRLTQITESYVGPTLQGKLNMLMTFRTHIYRSLRLFQYFTFLCGLDESEPEYYEFEVMTLEYFCRGSEVNHGLHADSTKLERDFYFFTKNISSSIPETEQFINSVEFVRNKLLVFEEMAETMELAHHERTLRKTYMYAAQFLKEYKHTTNVTALLQTSREKTSFQLMEEWFYASGKPTPYIRVPAPDVVE